MYYFEYEGKEYTSIESMPGYVREAYIKWRKEQNLPEDLLDFYEEELHKATPVNRGEKTLPSVKASAEHRLELLPSNCPNCGGPINGDNVKWTGAQSANCAFCGVNLPMRSESKAGDSK